MEFFIHFDPTSGGVKYGIDVICNIWAHGEMGTVTFKLNMFQRIFSCKDAALQVSTIL